MLFNKSLDSILGQFNKTVTRLEDFVDVANAQRDKKVLEVTKLNYEITSLDDDISRADTVRKNIIDLLSK